MFTCLKQGHTHAPHETGCFPLASLGLLQRRKSSEGRVSGPVESEGSVD